MGWEAVILRGSVGVGAVAAVCFRRFRFPSEVIVLAVRWYLRYGQSCYGQSYCEVGSARPAMMT